MPIKTRFLVLLKAKEAKEARRITYSEIHQETGLSVGALSAWSQNKITRFDAATLETLCRYFECQPSDLIYLE